MVGTYYIHYVIWNRSNTKSFSSEFRSISGPWHSLGVDSDYSAWNHCDSHNAGVYVQFMIKLCIGILSMNSRISGPIYLCNIWRHVYDGVFRNHLWYEWLSSADYSWTVMQVQWLYPGIIGRTWWPTKHTRGTFPQGVFLHRFTSTNILPCWQNCFNTNTPVLQNPYHGDQNHTL